MSNLVIVVFGDEFKAEEIRLELVKMDYEHLAELEDAVVVVRSKKGKVKLLHMTHLTLEGAVAGGFLGMLLGVILLNPVFAILGMATGVAVGGTSGSLEHLGIREDFIHSLAEHLRPGTSALCMIVSEHLDEVMEALGKFNGKIFQSSLLHDDEAELLKALESVGGV